MTDREQAYHGHQTDSERLDDIRRRLDALRVHSGETDYAHRVILDCAWLLAQVAELQTLGASLHKAADAGAQAERAAVVAWLRAEAYLTLYEATPSDVADAIERGEHRRGEGA
jgi:hypothetical protein